MMKNISAILIAVAVVLCGMSFANETGAQAVTRVPAVHRHIAVHNTGKRVAKRGNAVHSKFATVLRKHGKAFHFGKQLKHRKGIVIRHRAHRSHRACTAQRVCHRHFAMKRHCRHGWHRHAGFMHRRHK